MHPAPRTTTISGAQIRTLPRRFFSRLFQVREGVRIASVRQVVALERLDQLAGLRTGLEQLEVLEGKHTCTGEERASQDQT